MADTASANLNGTQDASPHADGLATGVVFMLALTVLQRGVGFGRSILFCQALDDDQLGQWSLAFSFMLLAAPLAVLGLTGSFGRYVEYYRVRNQLRVFLQRTACLAGITSLLAVAAIVLGRDWFAWIIFRDATQGNLVLAVGGTLAVMIVLNFVLEIIKALRWVRAASLMELANSLTFATVGFALLWTTSLGSTAVILAYGGGCLLAASAGAWLLWRRWSGFSNSGHLPHRDLWSKLAPFAAWLWVTNLLANLFDMADRYMILHFANLDPQAAAGLVGQYFSSLIVPSLMVAIAGMLSSVILPYLSHDWEAGRRERVSQRVHLALKLTAVGMLLGGVMIQLCGPLLFQTAWGGKFAEGQAILPWTAACCGLIGLGLMAHNFLLCAERAAYGSLAMLLGLGLNIGLNAILLPLWGLPGAVIATTTANGITLLIILILNTRLGMKWDYRVLLACSLPLALVLGGHLAALVLVVVLGACLRPNLLLCGEERQQLETLADRYLEKGQQAYGVWRQTRTPTQKPAAGS